MDFRSINFIPFALTVFLLTIYSAKAQLPTGTSLLANNLGAYVPVGVDAPKSMIEEVPVTGLTFSKALRINTFVQENMAREAGLTFPLTTPVKKRRCLVAYVSGT